MRINIQNILSILICILCNCVISYGQQNDVRFNNLTTKDGLSDDQVQCLLQDNQGFIWIGTRNGLNCYDGNTFTIYKHNAEASGSISDNAINDIFEDSHHQLWIATNWGLDRFDRKRHIFQVFLHRNQDNSSISNNYITKIIEDSKGNLWIGTRYGLNRYLPEKQKFVHYFHQDLDQYSINSNNIYQIAKDNVFSGNLWIVTAGGLNEFNSSTQQFLNKYNENIQYSYAEGALLDDSEHHLWYGTQSQLYLINRLSRDRVIFNRVLKNYNFNSIRDIVEDRQHNLWIGTRSGLIKFNYVTQKVSEFSHQAWNRYSLTKSEIWKLFFDNQGLLWIASYKGGVNILNTRNNMIDLYRNNPAVNNSLNNDFVLSFLEDRHRNIWIGTDGGGLNKFDPIRKIFTVYGIDKYGRSRIGSSSILSLLQDRIGTIWIGTWNGGLCRFDDEKNSYKIFKPNPGVSGALNNPNVWAMLEDKRGNLWIGTMGGGLNKLDRRTGIFTHFMYDPSNPDSSFTNDNDVWSLFQDSKDRIWVGSSKCLNMFNPITGHFKHFYQKEDSDSNLREVEVLCIYEDTKHRIWVGTGSDGLNLLDMDHLTMWGNQKGAPDVSVFGILNDDHNNLWLSTNNGIYKYNPDSFQSTNFDFTNGLQGNQFNQGAYMKSSEGQMYFGGSNGFNVFSPDSMKLNKFESPVVFTDFKIFNKSVPISNCGPLKNAINQTQEITLTWQQSVFTIEFACLSYVNPEKNQYAYMLEGFDKAWNYVGTKHDATYTNLNPGDYIFKVKAANNDGFWGNSVKTLKIKIKPPFWMTFWFRLSLIIFLIFILFGFYFWKVTRIARRNELLETLVSQRTKELETRTNEIEEKNLLLSNQAQTLNEINTLLEERQQHIEEQSEKLRNQKEALEINRDELSQLNATKDKLFSILAHDLRNPFQAIIGFSELLKSDIHKLPQEKVTKFINLIHSSSIRGNDLLNNILQWSRAQIGRITFEPEYLDLFELTTEITGLLEADAQQKNIHIDVLVVPNTKVYADKNMLQTILRNLMSNALKFTYENGVININAKAREGFLEISVSDNGVGIPKKNKYKLFHIDQTVTTQGTAHESGTGLGLILCKEFVERHGGAIRFESEPEKGTTFYFTLPLI